GASLPIQFRPSSLPFLYLSPHPPSPHSSPTRRSSDLRRDSFPREMTRRACPPPAGCPWRGSERAGGSAPTLSSPRETKGDGDGRSEEHTSELQSLTNLVCRLLLEKKTTLGGHTPPCTT